MPDDDPLDDVPEPETRFAYRVPWGILFVLALIPIAALIALLLL
jgi:hypothetical protein